MPGSLGWDVPYIFLLFLGTHIREIYSLLYAISFLFKLV
jgi:hypothetical protein